MYLYNITIKIETGLESDWLLWMHEEYIPQILTYKTFYEYKLYKILNIDDTDGATYALQLFAENELLIEQFLNSHLQTIQQIQQQRWLGRMYSFATLMENVH